MQTRSRLFVCLMAIAVAAAWWLWPESTRTPESNALKREPAAVATKPAADQMVDTNIGVAQHPTQAPEQSAPTSAPDPKNPFRVDGAGKLIVDEQTRLNLEALFAQTDRANLLEGQLEITRRLPGAAAAEAAAILERYDNYSKAQRETYPPGAAPATEEAALAELEGLHALRVAHFGLETAQAFYGKEEKVTRSLIDLMRLEKDQSLTMEEKAARAQQLYDAAPELTESDNNARSR